MSSTPTSEIKHRWKIISRGSKRRCRRPRWTGSPPHPNAFLLEHHSRQLPHFWDNAQEAKLPCLLHHHPARDLRLAPLFQGRSSKKSKSQKKHVFSLKEALLIIAEFTPLTSLQGLENLSLRQPEKRGRLRGTSPLWVGCETN